MSGNQPDGYSVKQIMESCTNCTQESALLCTEIECKKLCYHKYTCDEYCYDYTNGHVCKHIHRAHSLRLKVQACEPDYQCSSMSDNHELQNEPENESDIDDPLEFAENVRNLSTGNYHNMHYTAT